jgi:hypothetical protein
MRLAAQYSYEEFRAMHPDGKRPSDNTIRRWIRQGRLTRSGGGVVFHADLLDYFGLSETQLSKLIRATPDPVGVA